MFIFHIQVRLMKKDGREGKIAVIVGAITDDLRVHNIPKMKVDIVSLSCSVSCLLLSLFSPL